MPEVLQHGLLYLFQVLSGVQIGEGRVPRFVLEGSQFDVFLHATCSDWNVAQERTGRTIQLAGVALDGAQHAACAVASPALHTSVAHRSERWQPSTSKAHTLMIEQAKGAIQQEQGRPDPHEGLRQQGLPGG